MGKTRFLPTLLLLSACGGPPPGVWGDWNRIMVNGVWTIAALDRTTYYDDGTMETWRDGVVVSGEWSEDDEIGQVVQTIGGAVQTWHAERVACPTHPYDPYPMCLRMTMGAWTELYSPVPRLPP